MLHELKIEKPFYDAVKSGLKPFEIRLNDRGFQKGDLIQFKFLQSEALRSPEQAQNWTYREADELYEITYVMSGYGLKNGYVVLAIRPYGPYEKE